MNDDVFVMSAPPLPSPTNLYFEVMSLTCNIHQVDRFLMHDILNDILCMCSKLENKVTSNTDCNVLWVEFSILNWCMLFNKLMLSGLNWRNGTAFVDNWSHFFPVRSSLRIYKLFWHMYFCFKSCMKVRNSLLACIGKQHHPFMLNFLHVLMKNSPTFNQCHHVYRKRSEILCLFLYKKKFVITAKVFQCTQWIHVNILWFSQAMFIQWVHVKYTVIHPSKFGLFKITFLWVLQIT